MSPGLTVAVIHPSSTPPLTSRQLLHEAKKMGCTTRYLCPQEILALLSSELGVVKGQKNIVVDIAFPRGVGACSSIEQFMWRIDIVRHLELAGTLTINSFNALSLTRDKFLALMHLAKSGIPVPETVVTENLGHALRVIEEWGRVVVKPLIGSFGRGVMLLDNPDIAYSIFKQLLSWSQPLLLQKYYEKKNHRDLRVLVINGEAYATYYRRAREGCFKTNVAQGGIVEEARVSEDIIELAVKTAEKLGMFYAGVDLMEDVEGRYLVLEANASPLWRGALQLGLNPARKLVEEALKAYKR